MEHWWAWLPWIAVGLATLVGTRGKSVPLVWMTSGASLVQLAILPFKRQVYLQDFLLPAFGLSLVATLFVASQLRPRNARGSILMGAVLLILAGVNLVNSRLETVRYRLPHQPNGTVMLAAVPTSYRS